MAIFDNLFRRLEKFIMTIESHDAIMRLSITGGDLSFASRKWETIKSSSTDSSTISAEKALMLVPLCYMAGDMRVHEEILMAIGGDINAAPFVIGSGLVGLPVTSPAEAETTAKLTNAGEKIRQKTGACLNIKKLPISDTGILRQRLELARQFYCHEKGEWIEQFVNGLQDDLSKDSFKTFLTQYVKAFILRGLPSCYPVAPPAQSAAWRRKRMAMKHDFPILKGCADGLRDFFLRDTFILEQYAIPGVVKVKPGDVIIDAGAFIGDTACYFSRLTGPSGKVFAFEAVPDSAAHAKENMELNNCANVEIVPLALSDKRKEFTLILNEAAASASRIDDAKQTGPGCEVRVTAIPLDEFTHEKHIKIDFIKADIEGAELDMLNGARKTIKRDKPVLAFALYHKRDDFWQLPDFIHSLNPNYRFWFRCESEPVIFAKNI